MGVIYLSMLRLKLNHVRKKGPRNSLYWIKFKDFSSRQPAVNYANKEIKSETKAEPGVY